MSEINEGELREQIQSVLVILQAYAPEGGIEGACLEMLQVMQRDGMTLEYQLVTLVETLHNGLRHGNWPWTPYM